MSYLYKNVKGYEVKSHSYSGGLDWKCPRKYSLKRIHGWQSREEGAYFEFGKCVESAIQFFHAKGFEPGTGSEEFKLLWWKFRDDESLTYSEKGGNWEDHYRMGAELLALYELEYTTLPIQNEKFQVKFTKQLDDGLEFTAIADMVTEVSSTHPSLPPVEGAGETRKVIIDIKTSSASYFSDPRLAGLDPQLRYYSWATGVDTVAFLVLVKNHTELGSGDWVTVLRGDKQGKKYQVFDISESRVLVLNKTLYDEYTERKKTIKGTGSKELKDALLTEYFYKGHSFQRDDLTKQKISFLPAIITQEDRDETEYEARKEVLEISECGRNKYYPKKPGVKFPSNHCLNCEMLGHCLNDPALIKERLVQITGEF